MQDGGLEGGVAPLLADRRQEVDAAGTDLEDGMDGFAFCAAELDPVEAADTGLRHLVRDGAGPVAREPVDAGADNEVGAEFAREAEQLVDVALAVGDVDQAPRLAEELHRLAKAVEPTDALLALDRHAGRVDHPLERRRAFELRPCPDLQRRRPERHAVRSDGEAGVQEEAAQRVVPPPALGVAAAVDALGHADRRRGGAPVVNSVVSWSTRTTPRHALARSAVAAKWPPRMSASVTRSLDKKR